MTDNVLYRVLREWNDTSREYPKDVCLHQLFEVQAELKSDTTAVMFERRQLTFKELNQYANQLAHYLRSLDVGPEVLVGIFMERSLEMVIGLYSILKAGGAYVPLDPEYPRERISFMLKDTQVSVLLTQEHLISSLPEHEAKVICLDTDWETISKQCRDNPISEVRAENLAYVIYTSGSTGRPKGVMNCHRGICNRLLWMQETFQLKDTDHVLQKTPFSFDVSVWEFFWPLLAGASLFVAQPGGHKDSAYLVRTIVEQKITTLHFVPSMLHIFLDEKDVERCRSLKRIICSGEALSYDLKERFFARLDAELYNLYGPTEAAVDVTYWHCQRGSDQKTVPIGRPIANTQIYILNQDMQPVPPGIPGELHIGGVQVARGYLNRPELTAEKFIPDPFGKSPGDRLYKTGDLACYLPGGEIKYLGRIDHQVKIRGVRIELGEIESILETHTAIKQAVVLAREDETGDKRLVAYLVSETGQTLNTTQLRSYLQEKLPESMIPSIFIILDVMPLMANGKVDRRALPAPSRERPELEYAYVPPRNQLERHLADIWCDLLKLNRIGIYDRFFELGGNSLKAAQFINKLQQELGENIYIVSIFEAPSIAEYGLFLQKNYTDSIVKKFDLNHVSRYKSEPSCMIASGREKIDSEAIARFHECIPHMPQWNGEDVEDTKNLPAIFILAPPRSGTTLLRVMLAGHPDLFAASELQLLGFHTLEERRKAFTGKFSLWLEGTIRIIMEIKGCNAEEAGSIMNEFEMQSYTTKQFYRVLQDWIRDKTLVDKSPSYVLDLNTLEKAERDFNSPLYIHLIRHPYAMVRSFVNYHMDQVLFLKDHSFSPYHLAELVWLISHKNTIQFLQKVPKNRQCRMRFEDLVNKPEEIMEELCQRFRLTFHPSLTKPYKDIDKKMTNGIYKDSKPMGDTKFLNYQSIDPKVAESWKGVLKNNFLSDITWELATSFGYDPPNYANMISSSYSHNVRKHSTDGRRELIDRQRRFRQKRMRR